jgi:hypothetical protein
LSAQAVTVNEVGRRRFQVNREALGLRCMPTKRHVNTSPRYRIAGLRFSTA